MIEFLTISMFIILATLSPGPDFALVSRNALRYSQRTGMMTGLGIMAGTFFHSCYCILGFAVIIQRSLIVFSIIKYAGAIYLIYLGFKGLFEKEAQSTDNHDIVQNQPTDFQAFQQGLFCTALNPKAILFFIAFFTLLIHPTMPITEQCLYALEIGCIDIIWFLSISYFFSHKRMKLFLGKSMHYVNRLFGGFLIVCGVKIASVTKMLG